jgi:hypothetical protein
MRLVATLALEPSNTDFVLAVMVGGHGALFVRNEDAYSTTPEERLADPLPAREHDLI